MFWKAHTHDRPWTAQSTWFRKAFPHIVNPDLYMCEDYVSQKNVLRNITDPYTISLSIYLLAVTRTVFTSWLFVNTALNVGMEDTVSGDAGWLNVPKRDYEIHTSYAFNFFGSTHADFCTSCSGLHPLQQYTRIFFFLSSH